MEWPEKDKLTHEDAMYHASRDIDHCFECSNFIKPDKCQHVKSPVSRNGWCRLFEENYGHPQ